MAARSTFEDAVFRAARSTFEDTSLDPSKLNTGELRKRVLDLGVSVDEVDQALNEWEDLPKEYQDGQSFLDCCRCVIEASASGAPPGNTVQASASNAPRWGTRQSRPIVKNTFIDIDDFGMSPSYGNVREIQTCSARLSNSNASFLLSPSAASEMGGREAAFEITSDRGADEEDLSPLLMARTLSPEMPEVNPALLLESILSLESMPDGHGFDGLPPTVAPLWGPHGGISTERMQELRADFAPLGGDDTPPFGYNHYFHMESMKTGPCYPQADQFNPHPDKIRMIQKGADYEGLLSLVTEEKVNRGVIKYIVSFDGDMSKADGVGFVFASSLPIPKNIKKICSLFLNKQGRVKVRAFDQMFDCQIPPLPEIQQGEWVEMSLDLPRREATFTIWPWDARYYSPLWGPYKARTQPIQYARWFENHQDVNLNAGHLACVLKNRESWVQLAS